MATESSITKINNYIQKYWKKTGTTGHPDKEITNAVVEGLAKNMDEVGRPLCPCNFYKDKKQEVATSRRWLCACDEMKIYKYCHCLLFVREDGQPITEYLPEDHPGRKAYGVVADPSPELGREGNKDL